MVTAFEAVEGLNPPESTATTSPPVLVTASARVNVRHSLPRVQALASFPVVATKASKEKSMWRRRPRRRPLYRSFIDGSPNSIHDFFTSGSFTTAFARWHASPIVIELELKSWRNSSAFITAC